MVPQDLAAERVSLSSPRRAGFVIPSSNRRFEPEAAAFLPAAIVPHVARARITGAHKGEAKTLEQRIIDAARCLADARCELIVFHCTGHSTELGPDGEQEVTEAIRAATGVAAAATGQAIRAAFSALPARRIAIITPYDRATTNAEVRYFQACGFEVVHVRAYDLAGSDAFCSTPAAFWRDVMIANRQMLADADAVLLSCANIRCLESLSAIESAAARPLITSNQAALWFAARTVAGEVAVPRLGCLSKLPLPGAFKREGLPAPSRHS